MSAAQNTSLFNFGGGVNQNPTGSTTPVFGKDSTYTANGYFPSTGGSTGLPGNPFPTLPNNAFNQLYGGLGPYLAQFINSGAGYNSNVLNSLINQIQPQVNRGLATLEATAGATGNRYGSAYQIGAADYLSQVNQNELGMASGLYENSVQNILNLLGSIYPLQAQYHNNQGGFLSSLLSSLIPTIPGIIGGITGNTGGSTGGGGGIGNIGGTGGSVGGTGNINLPGGSSTPIPGVNENWGGTYNPTWGTNPPGGGNTGIPGGQIAAASGSTFLDNLLKYFNPVPGQPLNLGHGTLDWLSGGTGADVQSLPVGSDTSQIPTTPELDLSLLNLGTSDMSYNDQYSYYSLLP